ncbi:single-stranded DNA-binding protein [Microbacterium sp. W1N]|uniref:single-stranded DNA-binding protein n=1 Tax=Microbacterium festucae TaxID=2977531 RepID=UPI0021C1F959|nr:single-stranded DNA-binding protein [Microbacterium festucae]MCT9820269.1 single-stranded DNA-binding protein [Microbacterium festucae]
MSEQITLVGNIATTPERRTTAAGIPIANFRIACSERKFDEQSRAWVDGHTSFYSVSAYRALAEHALASLRLGERVIVTGSLRVRTWESGNRHGTAADVDASALGHDLRWGTSSFQRSQSPATYAAAGGEAPGSGTGAPAAAQDWAPSLAPSPADQPDLPSPAPTEAEAEAEAEKDPVPF